MLDTLTRVKSRLGITVSTYDTFLTQQITLVSDVIEAYCRRKFLQTDWIQTFYASDKEANKLELFYYPVCEVTELKIDGVEVEDTYFRLHKPTGIINPETGSALYCSDKTVVKYTAGYETCPTPVLSVLDSIISERYNKKVSGVDLNFGSDVQRISIPGAISIDFDYTLKNNDRTSSYGVILGNNANILDDWRSERSVIGSGKLEYVEEA